MIKNDACDLEVKDAHINIEDETISNDFECIKIELKAEDMNRGFHLIM